MRESLTAQGTAPSDFESRLTVVDFLNRVTGKLDSNSLLASSVRRVLVVVFSGAASDAAAFWQSVLQGVFARFGDVKASACASGAALQVRSPPRSVIANCCDL